MKKIILILICFLPLMAFSQYRAFTGNWDFVGKIKLTQTFYVDTVQLTKTDFRNFKTAYSWGNHAGLYYAKGDTATSILSRPRAANTYQVKGSYLDDNDFTSNGLMKRTASGTYTNISDSSIYWNYAYTKIIDTIPLDSMAYLKAGIYSKTEVNNLLSAKANIAGPSFTGGLMSFTASATYPGTLFIGNGGSSLSHTTGDEAYYNTYFGTGAGQINSTGYNNTGTGYEALRYNSTGSSNTATGFNALRGNQTSNHNTATGYNSGGALTSGSGYNSYYGSSSGSNSQTGEENSAFGAYAGRGGTATVKNSALGAYALFTGGGSSNVALGYQAGYYETGSSKLFIDNQKRTNEADARTKALIYGVFNAATASQQLTFNAALIYFPYLPTYADNAAAVAAGLTAGRVYKTSTGVLMIVY